MMTIGRKEFFSKLDHKIHDTGLQMIKIAYQLSKYGHKGQTRDDGTRVFDHPKECAIILIDELLIFDFQMICAMFLHDIKEDSFILGLGDIEFIFGKTIRDYVQLLTKMDDQSNPKAKRDLDYHRRIFSADIKVKILKLVDRLHNLRTLAGCDFAKQIKIIRETIEIFLPLALETNDYLYQKIKEICDQYCDQYPDSFVDLIKKEPSTD
ncbi:HD domain-containing protein [Patescibacteria group bacterium]